MLTELDIVSLLLALRESGTVLCGHGVSALRLRQAASLGCLLSDGDLCGAWIKQRLRYRPTKLGVCAEKTRVF